MTKQELIKILDEKIENASNDFERTVKIMGRVSGNEKEYYTPHFHALRGEIDAYTDVICLIESSGVLDEK